MHVATAAGLFNVPVSEVTKEQKATGKIVNFAPRWIRFEYVAPEKNRFREYGITISQNLFGEWVVSSSWVRIGGPKRVKQA